MSDAQVRRLAPPDRHAPVDVQAGRCPLNSSCYCCPKATERGHGRGKRACVEPHPREDRQCSLPIPENIPPCPEQRTMPQHAPTPPAGYRAPHMSCCVQCGRITALRWIDPEGRPVPWCAGLLPEPRPLSQ